MLIAAVVGVVVSHNPRQSLPSPSPAPRSEPSQIAVKPVEPKDAPLGPMPVDIPDAVAVVCGADGATADRYEARNDALRSIARQRDLPPRDVAALIAYLRAPDESMRVERVAALKNDVMNLLRFQRPPPSGLAETLAGMFEGGGHPPAVLDYCIQHLGAMLGGIADGDLRRRVRAVLVGAARQADRPYSGTALYSLADDGRASPEEEAELRRLAVALCRPGVNSAARMSAMQLAGERGYGEVLPILRESLSAPGRDAVLDIVCIGTLGLLGDADDLAVLSRFAEAGGRRAHAAETAIRRIKERSNGR